MDKFTFVWNAATSYVKFTLSLKKEQTTNDFVIAVNASPKKEIMDWLRTVGWEKVSCMDESIFMTSQERDEWKAERESKPNDWTDFIAALSYLYEETVTASEPTNLIWDHVLSLCLVTWDVQEDTMGIKELASKSDSELEGSDRHIKEVIRALKRIRQAEVDPTADKAIDEDESNDGSEKTDDAELDDEVLLGLQSKMKDMMSKIQDPDSGLGKLMKEIMDELKTEKLDLDPKTMMDVCMKTMMGGVGAGKGGLESLKDGPLGKIISIVERKIKAKMEAGGVDELKNILDSTKDLFGNNPEEMKETLSKLLNSMVKKMGLPKQAQSMIFGKMNKIIESMTKQFMNGDKDTPAPTQENMQNMLAENMNEVMKQFMQQQSGGKISQRKMNRMAARGRSGFAGGSRNPQMERLQRLKERLRKKHEDAQKNKESK